MHGSHSPSQPVLVVEDDADIRETIAEVLREEGYPVEVAANGAEALAVLRREDAPRPRLILLDLMMPVLNGWELHDVLRTLPGCADIPVVVLTGDANAKAKADELGAAGGMGKPVSLQQLLEVIERF